MHLRIYAFAYIRKKDLAQATQSNVRLRLCVAQPLLAICLHCEPPGAAQPQEHVKEADSKVLPSVETAVGTQPAVAAGKVTAAGKDPFSLVDPQTHMRIFACAQMRAPREEKRVYGEAYPDPCICIPFP